MVRKNGFWSLMLLFAVFTFATGGCGGGGGGDSGGENEPAPAGLVTSDSPAVSLGAVESDNPLFASFADRLTSKAPDSPLAEAAVIILSSGAVIDEAAGSADLGKQIRDAYGRGGIIVVLEPVLADLNKLSALTGAHLSAAEDNGGERFCDIYAFVDSETTGFHTYVLGDREGRYDDVAGPAGGVSAAGPRVGAESAEETEEIKPDTPGAPPALSEEEYKAILDHFVEWINNKGPKNMAARLQNMKAAARKADTANDVLALVKAQTVTFNNSMTAPWSLDGFQPTALYTDTYFIYAVYDKDHSYDYYIFDQECDLASGNMYKGLWTNSDWGSNTHLMAYYLYDYYTDHYLQNSGGAFLSNTQHNIIQPSPTTTTGSTSYTTSQQYTIGGSLGFNGMSGTGSVSGSMSYSQSHTTSIPDITVKEQCEQPVTSKTGAYNNARWTYAVGNLPHPKNEYTIFYPHKSTITPEPPAIATTTATLYNTWIWRVSNPSGTYKVLCRSRPRYAYCEGRASYPDWTYIDNGTLDDESTLNNGWTQERSITLIAPPRS
ncbi:MAG: hypothetical protein LBO82_05775 [Synergistaceae bacterium]|nr:hypothetical protein [Synergistaceae bacterium]